MDARRVLQLKLYCFHLISVLIWSYHLNVIICPKSPKKTLFEGHKC